MERHGKMADAIKESLDEEDEDPSHQPSEEESDDTDDSDYDNCPLAEIKSRPSLASKKRPASRNLQSWQFFLTELATLLPCGTQ